MPRQDWTASIPSPGPRLITGDRSAGPWDFGECLGQGGLARVFLAKHRETGAVAVVKQARADDGRGPATAEAALQREGTIHGRLCHPRIVTLLDQGQADGRFYLVFEYMPNGSLKGLIERTGHRPLPLPLAATLVMDALDGLAATHAQGTVHNDLKPSNLLLDAAGRAKLSDFGIAARADGPDPLFGFAPPQYMAPERHEDPRAASPRSDLFAIGVVLYELLTGTLPFSGPDVEAVRQTVLRRRPFRPRGIRPEVPIQLEEIVLALLEKGPDRRPASAGTVAEALRSLRLAGSADSL